MSEGFSNAIVGGAETLVREAIQSQSYVAGSVGWRIARDGTAEFNAATVRGDLVVGTAPAQMLFLKAADIPAELVAKYGGNPLAAAVISYTDADTYWYQVLVTGPSRGIAEGWSILNHISGLREVWEAHLYVPPSVPIAPGVASITQEYYGASDAIDLRLMANSFLAPISRVGALTADHGGVSETYHAFTYQNGWANAGGAAIRGRYKLVPSPANSVQMVGTFTPGTKADGTQIAAALNSDYWPISSQDLPLMVDSMAGGTAQSPHFNITTAGVITCWGCANATRVSVNATFPLDI